MSPSPTFRIPLTALLAPSLLVWGLAAGCSSKSEEPKSDEDIWEEATGEPADEGFEAEAAEATDEAAEAAEAAGEAAEEGAEEAGEAVEGAVEETGEALEEAGEDVQEAAEGEEPSSALDGPTPTEVYADGSRLYGEKPGEGTDRVALAELMADAGAYDGRTVRTEGEIAQVCQAMGCWMELRPGADDEAIRVPMAGHSFFLPKDVAGRRATVQGRVKVRAPSPEVQAHLRAEGALAAAQPVSLEATGVVVH